MGSWQYQSAQGICKADRRQRRQETMDRNRRTVADMLALKGKRQISMLYVDKVEEAAAASEAGIDMLSIINPVWTREMREAAGNCFVQVGLIYGEQCTYEDY